MQTIIGHIPQRKQLEQLRREGKLSRSIIFTGPSGVGKKLIAERFVMSMFCAGADKKPCGVCDRCLQISSRTFPDFIVLGPNENGIIPVGEPDEPDTMRHLIHKLSYRSSTGSFAVIVDGIERASEEAQNAFLKTLEEPPDGSCIILISSERSKVLPTILSRCHEVRFGPLSKENIAQIVSDKVPSDEILSFISACACGSAEIALWLADESSRNSVLTLVKTVRSSVIEGKAAVIPAALALKPKKGPDPVDLCINIFSWCAEIAARASLHINPLLDDIYIDDITALVQINKLLISVKRGRINNMNAPLQLKAESYAAYASDGSAQ